MSDVARRVRLVLFLSAFVSVSAQAWGQDARSFVVAGGPVGGSYYRLAGQVCEAVAQSPASENWRCLVLPPGGSGENLALLADGGADFAIVQSDWLYRAQSEFGGEDRPDAAPRSVVALEGRAITVLIGPESGIASLEDLQGKRLSFGPTGSPLAFGGEILLAALGWEPEDLGEIVPLDLADLPAALCDGRIDAFVLPLVHPDPMVDGALKACALRLLEVRGEEIEKALQAWPFLSRLTIGNDDYPDLAGAAQSFGLRAMLTTGAGQETALVAVATEAVVVRGHGDWILTPGPVAPVHPAALEILVARGLASAPAASE
jgi:TRAP transporter TAXI family solute receptor